MDLMVHILTSLPIHLQNPPVYCWLQLDVSVMASRVHTRVVVGSPTILIT